MKYILLLVVLAVFSIVNAQTTKAAPSRASKIWDVATSRMGDQADTWYDVGDYPRSTQMLKFMASADPNDYEANSNLGWMLENMERWDEALATYVRFRKNNPNNAEAAYPEANFYFLQRAYSKVPPLLEPTMANKPHADSYVILGHSYERLGLLTDAERVFKLMLADHPEHPASKNNLLRVQRKLAQQKGASGHP